MGAILSIALFTFLALRNTSHRLEFSSLGLGLRIWFDRKFILVLKEVVRDL